MIVDGGNAWERASIRAAARGLTAEWIKMAGQGQVCTEYWKTDSTSAPGTFHYVRLEYGPEGVDALCDCRGAQDGKACAHVAAAVDASTAMIQVPRSEHEPQEKPLSSKEVNDILFGDLVAD